MMLRLFKIAWIALSVMLVVWVMPQRTLAQSSGGGLVPCGNGDYSYDASQPGATPPANNGPTDKMCTVDDLFRIVVIVANFLIGFAGLVAVLMIVRHGVGMITSGGTAGGIAAAKKGMLNAIIGLVLTFLAFMLVNTLLTNELGIGLKGGGNIFTNTVNFIKGN